MAKTSKVVILRAGGHRSAALARILEIQSTLGESSDADHSAEQVLRVRGEECPNESTVEPRLRRGRLEG